MPRLFEIYYFLKFLPLRLWHLRGPMTRKGFVGVQIDGLAHDDLVYAIEQGYARRLGRWLRDGQCKLAAYPSGLPSATSYAQAGIFYGENDNIPAFRWYERGDRQVVNCNRPHSEGYLRATRGGNPGVLRGGSSIVNLIDGDADRAALTANSSVPRSLFEELGGFRFLLLILFHPVRLVMTLLATLWEMVLELYDRYVVSRGRHSVAEGWFPVVRALTNVVFRELQTLAVMADVYAGVPYIFTTYGSYDELAHHYGPRSRPALKNLKYILGRIHEIRKMLRRLPGRHHDLVILSDHGQTPGTPFLREFGVTLGGALHHHLESHRLSVQSSGRSPTAARPRELYAQHLRDRAGRRSFLVRGVLRSVARVLHAVASVESYLPEKYYVDEDNDIVVTYSGTLALVYFSRFAKRLDDEAIRRDYPHVLDFLVGHSGVGLVATRAADGGLVLRSAGGEARLVDGEITIVEGDDPLAPYDAGPLARRALQRMGAWPNTGDLILFGRYADGQIVCFDDQVASHGCLGGPQFWPFILLPTDPRFEGLLLTDPRDLYHLIFEPYHRGEDTAGKRGA